MPETVQNPLTPITSLVHLGDLTWLLFLLVVGAYVIFTAVFYYHWQQYGTNARITWLTYILYLVTTLPLVVIASSLSLTT